MKETPNVTEIVDLEAAENCVKIEQVKENYINLNFKFNCENEF